MLPLKTAKADLIYKYKLHLKISFIISISLLILAFKLSPMPGRIEPIKKNSEGPIVLSQIDPTLQKPKVPDPPKLPELIPAKLNEPTNEVIFNNNEIDKHSDLGKPDPFKDKPILEKEDLPYLFVEEMPTIIGGYEALYKNLHYTEIAKRTEITGTVVIELVVDKDGNPTEVKVVKSIGGGLDDIALNAVKNLKFTPGIQSGKPVKVRMNIPIKFVLK
jgi:protein TonB